METKPEIQPETDMETADKLKSLGFKLVECSDKSCHWWELKVTNPSIFHEIYVVYDDEDGSLVFEIYAFEGDEPIEAKYFEKNMHDLMMIEAVLQGAKILT